MAGVVALLCLAAAVVIERAPRVPTAPIPTAADVRSGVEFAQTLQNLASAHRPMPVRAPLRWFDGVHRLVGYAKDNLAMDAVRDRDIMRFRVSKRLAAHAWLNLAVGLEEGGPDAPPVVSLYAGSWRAPDALTQAALRFGLRFLGDEYAPVRSLKDVIPRYAVDGDAIDLTARLPKGLIGGLQAVLGSGGGTSVDMEQVRAIYGRLLAHVLLHPSPPFGEVAALAVRDAGDQDDLRAAVVALTMLVDGPRVRRLARERSATPPCPLDAQVVVLHGRSDLPRHWVVSAGLALFLDARPARAAGLWKELDDSLPGGDGRPAGTGFSFIDLAADMAGAAVGKAARDGAGTEAVLAVLRTGKQDALLPPRALALPEGIPLAEYERRYGGLDQPNMLRAEAKLRAVLGGSPLYRAAPPAAP